MFFRDAKPKWRKNVISVDAKNFNKNATEDYQDNQDLAESDVQTQITQNEEIESPREIKPSSFKPGVVVEKGKFSPIQNKNINEIKKEIIKEQILTTQKSKIVNSPTRQS